MDNSLVSPIWGLSLILKQELILVSGGLKMQINLKG
jgi:hypothetical protein